MRQERILPHHARHQRLGSAVFASQQRSKINIPQGYLYRNFMALLTVTISTGVEKPVFPSDASVLSILKEMRVSVNGTQHRHVTKGSDIFYDEHIFESKGLGGLVNIDRQADEKTYEIPFTLTFTGRDIFNPNSYALDTRGISASSTVDLEIEWGSVADLFGTVNSAVIESANIEFYSTSIIPEANAIGGGALAQSVGIGQSLFNEVIRQRQSIEFTGNRDLTFKAQNVSGTVLTHLVVVQRRFGLASGFKDLNKVVRLHLDGYNIVELPIRDLMQMHNRKRVEDAPDNMIVIPLQDLGQIGGIPSIDFSVNDLELIVPAQSFDVDRADQQGQDVEVVGFYASAGRGQ